MKHRYYLRDVIYAGIFLVMIGSSHNIMAKNLIVDTPNSQPEYEPIHQGVLIIKAALFNAPCNLSFKNKYILTECGAGRDYQKIGVSDVTADTPAMLQFFDIPRGVSSMRYPILLSNGNNEIKIPLKVEGQSSLRIEVSYE